MSDDRKRKALVGVVYVDDSVTKNIKIEKYILNFSLV